MLTLVIPPTEEWDAKNEVFVYSDEVVLELEHTLVSLSKWEAIWEKPFLGPDEKTTEEILGYIGIMAKTPNLPPEVFQRLTQAQVDEVNAYLNAKMTATWFSDNNKGSGKKGREIITAELIYYWLIALNIPTEFENWHLSRLFTLIEVVNRKNQPAKKSTQSRSDMIAERRRLNAQRKAQMQSQG